jgi:predicted aspartyl protease
MTTRILLSLAALAGAAFPALAQTSTVDEAALVRWSNGLLVTYVEIDGSQPRPFVIDTGAAQSVIRTEALEGLEVNPPHETVVVHGILGMSVMQEMLAKSLRVGSMIVTDVPLLVAPPTERDILIYGLIGHDLLQHSVVELDPTAGRMRLSESMPEGRAGGDGSRGAIAFERGAEGLIYAPVEVNGVRGVAVFDSGLDVSVMNSRFARRAGFTSTLETMRKKSQVRDVADKRERFDLASFSSVRFAGLERNEVMVNVGDAPIFEQLGLSAENAMILGLNFFEGEKLIIDYPNGVLRIDHSAGERPS